MAEPMKFLKKKDLKEGVILLGQLCQRKNKSLYVSLPNFLIGSLNISELNEIFSSSDNYKELLKNLIGRAILCCVSSKEPLQLSIDPCKTNECLSYKSLVNGDCIWGYISSKEDNGYIIELGIEVSGFFATTKNYRIGTFKFFTITKIQTKIIELTGHKRSTIGKTIYPGNLVKCSLVQQGTFSASFVLSNGRRAYINPYYYEPSIPDDAELIILTVNEDFILLADKNIHKIPKSYEPGKIITASVTANILNGCVCLLSDKTRAFFSNYFCNDFKFGIGKKIDLKILNNDWINGCLQVATILTDDITKKSKSLIVGKVVNGVVIYEHESGFRIKITQTIFGFAPKYLIGDESLKINDPISCRIIFINLEKNSIILTTNPLFVYSDLPILDSYDFEHDESQWYHGYVQNGFSSYVIVKFYNDISGILHKNEAFITQANDMDKAFPRGTILKVRISSFEPKSNRLSLSMKPLKNTKDSAVVRIFNPQISHNIHFNVHEDDIPKFTASKVCVPDFHLSDFTELIPCIKMAVKKISEPISSVFFGRDPFIDFPVSSLKYSIIKTIELGKYPYRISDVCLGMTLPGFVVKILDLGYLIMIGFNVIGFLPVSLTNFKPELGASITVFVHEVDQLRNRIILTTSPRNLNYSHLLSHLYGVGLLLSYFKEYDQLTQLLKPKIPSRGSILKIKVGSKKDNFYSSKFRKMSVSLYAPTSCELTKGETVRAVLIFWDIENAHLYVALKGRAKKAENISVFLVKNFPRFGLGFFGNKPVIVVTNPTLNKFEVPIKNSMIECHVDLKFQKILICVLTNNSSIFTMKESRPCTITEILPTILTIQDGEKNGLIHISNVASNVTEGDRPFDRFNIGDQIDVRYLPSPNSKKNQRYFELTSYTTPLNPPEIKVSDTVVGFIQSVFDRRILIELNSFLKGYLNIIDLLESKNINDKPLDTFTPGTAINVVVMEINPNSKILKFCRKLPEQISLNQIVNVRVFKHGIYGIYTDLPFNQIAYIHLTNMFENFIDQPYNKFPIGSIIQGRVIKFENKQVHLTIKNMHGEISPSLTSKSIRINDVYQAYVIKVLDNCVILALSDSLIVKVNPEDFINLYGSDWKHQILIHSVFSVNVTRVLKPDFVEGNLVFMNEMVKPICDNVPCLKLEGQFDWMTGMFADNESPSQYLPSISTDVTIEPPSKKQKLNEIEIRKIENRLSSNTLLPSSKDDFDRLVIASPNSSIVWVAYMAFYLNAFEIEKARKISERALKTLSFKYENELRNLWISIINMECLYGTSDTFEDAQKRAVVLLGKKHLCRHLINLFIEMNRLEEAERECRVMLKIFPQSKKAYIIYGTLLAKQSRFLEMKNLMKTALGNLPNAKHIKTIVQFSLVEFRFGDYRRGAALLESVLNNFPNRTDIWFVYTDQLIKANQIDRARSCFQSLIDLPLKKSKRIAILKKYLNFERQFGNSEAISTINQQISQVS